MACVVEHDADSRSKRAPFWGQRKCSADPYDRSVANGDHHHQKAQPGWYDDGQGNLRWWDGTQWSEQYVQPGAGPRPASTNPSNTAVLWLVLGIVGTVLFAIIGVTSSGFSGFLIGASLPILVTAIIGLARRHRTWLNVNRGAMVAAAIVSAVVLFAGTLSAPVQVALHSAARNSHERGPAASSSPSPGKHTPTPTSTPVTSPTTAANPARDQVALNVLATLSIRPRSEESSYDRVVDFGTAWLDVDHNGCDTRDDILARDLTSVVKRGLCTVESGILTDPYTGKTITFTRGVETSRAVQIDHVVPLGDAWATGASLLTFAQRASLANDPLNLLAVDGPTNEAKSDKDASEWLPPNAGFACTYVARQVAVKATYHLWVTQAEHDTMAATLSACPAQSMPVSGFASGPTQAAPVPQPPSPAPAPAAPAPAPAAPAPAPGDAGVVHPGAFCSPVGAVGVTSAGTPMVCGPTANSSRARWHAAG